MRGDSLRDLYAKALALLGLGLLAATGALVDYWPVQGDIPGVASVFVPPPGLALPSLAAASAARPVWGVESPSVARPVQPLATSSADAVLADASDTSTAEPPDSPVLPTLEVPPSLAVTSAGTTNMPVSTLELLPPVISAAEATPDLSFSPVQTSQNGGNMLSGAAKTMGRVGSKTGSAVWDGFVSVASVVGHVFRW